MSFFQRYLLFFFSGLFSLTLNSQTERASDFKLMDVNENSQNFSELNRDAYVVLHFWSSSDLGSRKNNNALKQLVKDYQIKKAEEDFDLKIVAVGLDKSRQGWLMAIESDQLNDFVNLNDSWGLNSQLAKKFRVNKLPFDILISPEGEILQYDISPQEISKKLSQTKRKKSKNIFTDLFAKIMEGDIEAQIPIAHKLVYLLNNRGDTVRVTETDDFGDFVFRKVNAAIENTIAVGKEVLSKSKNQTVLLAMQNGTVITTLKLENNQFKYRLLESDFTKLSEIQEEEDPKLALNRFMKEKKSELIISRNIYYNSDHYEPDSASVVVIKQIAKEMKANKVLKLEVFSHTDSKGDDNYNLSLSERRVSAVLDMLTSFGVEKSRLKGKGLGETKILNRCKNGVNCSEKEQVLNRRTEFKFIK